MDDFQNARRLSTIWHTLAQKNSQIHTHKIQRKIAQKDTAWRWASCLNAGRYVCAIQKICDPGFFGRDGRDRSGARALGSTWASWLAWPLAPQICPVLRFYMQGVKVYPKVQNAPQATPGALRVIACFALLSCQKQNARPGYRQAGIFALCGLCGLLMVFQHCRQKKSPRQAPRALCAICWKVLSLSNQCRPPICKRCPP